MLVAGVTVKDGSRLDLEGKVKSFDDLVVWQRAIALAKVVYGLQKLLPKEERYAIGDQLRRAAVSVASNIAEGFGRDSAKDFMHFLLIARGSLYELRTQVTIARELGYLSDLEEFSALAAEEGRLLNAFISKLRTQVSQ